MVQNTTDPFSGPRHTRDPDHELICGAWGPLQAPREPARCQVQAGHTGPHRAYTAEGEILAEWRTAYRPLGDLAGATVYTLPPDGRTGPLPEFYQRHPDWRKVEQLVDAGRWEAYCRENNLGASIEDDDPADASSPEQPNPDAPASRPSRDPQPLEESTGADSSNGTVEPEPLDPLTVRRLEAFRQHPDWQICEDVDDGELDDASCRRWWGDGTAHVCQQEPDTCKHRPASRERRHECACGKNRTGTTYGPLQATATDSQPLEHFDAATQTSRNGHHPEQKPRSVDTHEPQPQQP